MPDEILDSVIDELRAEKIASDEGMNDDILSKLEIYRSIRDGVDKALAGEGILSSRKKRLVRKATTYIIEYMEKQ